MGKTWFITILFWNSLTLVELELLKASTENVAAVVGQPVTHFCSCSSGSNIHSLYFTPVGSRNAFPLWSSGIGIHINFTEQYLLSEDQFNVKLYLKSTNLNTAGTVTCKLTISEGEAVQVIKSTAQLIVLDGNLVCNSSTRDSALRELQPVEMHCNIGYRGNWAPVMEWRLSGENDQVVREGVQTTNISNFSVTSVLKFVVNHTMNNRNVSCKTYFSDYTGNVPTTATNIPEYSYTWTSPSLNVTYGPRNLAITPVKESYRAGDKLTCSADANPSPIYEWKNNSTGYILNTGPDFTVPSLSTVPSSVLSLTVKCTAINSVGSNSTTNTIILSSELDPQLNLLICLGIVCCLLLLFIILISGKQIKDRCRRFCAERKRQRMETNSSEAIQHMDAHVPGITLPGHGIVNPQTAPPGYEHNENSTLYAVVNKKSKKQKKIEPDIVVTKNRPITYLGADGTEYLEMGSFTPVQAGGFAHPDKHPPPKRRALYEAATYASIDHNISVPPPKMKITK